MLSGKVLDNIFGRWPDSSARLLLSETESGFEKVAPGDGTKETALLSARRAPVSGENAAVPGFLICLLMPIAAEVIEKQLLRLWRINGNG